MLSIEISPSITKRVSSLADGDNLKTVNELSKSELKKLKKAGIIGTATVGTGLVGIHAYKHYKDKK